MPSKEDRFTSKWKLSSPLSETTVALLPSYKEITKQFGFPVPTQYYQLLELSFILGPNQPWKTFEPLGLYSLDATLANPSYFYSGHDYADTPVEIYVIGWTGADGGHYGFVVDDLPSEPVEFPIAEVYPGSGSRLLGRNISEFLSVRLSEVLNDRGPKWLEDNEYIISMLEEKVHCSVFKELDAHLHRTLEDRIRAGAVMTLDGCGSIVPKDQIDWQAWDAIDWGDVSAEQSVPEHLLVDAERRMTQGDHITAFLIARNFRFLYWHRDFKSDRSYIRRTSSIMESVYTALGRPHLAKKIRLQTEWAVGDVL